MSRQIVLDTETTGLEPSEGHRIIEIGCVVLENRRPTGQLHWYLNPERDIDEGAFRVHGISRAFLSDKPRFAERAAELMDFLHGAELLIHNAAFDVGFLDHEFALTGVAERTADLAEITDTWALAKKKHPGQRNSLDALCRRYEVDNSNRDLHGALLDAQLLAEVYLLMTGGQARLELGGDGEQRSASLPPAVRAFIEASRGRSLRVQAASADETAEHRARLAEIAERAGHCLWQEEQQTGSED